MYHTIFAPLTRRQQRQIARLLALALLPLVVVTSTGDAAERLPVPVAVATSVRRIRRRHARSHPVAPPLRGFGSVLRRTPLCARLPLDTMLPKNRCMQGGTRGSL
ncbi:hypothetical protein, partial [Candidatus Chloroploca asiatica]|uniref:hypothetical protein n=1 Tax=Candidatus Chloroploca asiatica TaxID=1506545 RepID=UPI001143341F